ncbi:MAG: 2OG-Fe(II) oxygenase [Neisseriaceae bacterium]|jgi:hypothetical protein
MTKLVFEKVITKTALDQESISSLLNDKIIAIRIPQYSSPDICEQIAKGLFKYTTKFECYHHELKNGEDIEYVDYGVDRFGVSFNTTYNGDKEHREKYYLNAIENIRLIRSILPNQLSPFDRFRLEIDEIWLFGVGLANFEGRKMFAGVPRIMTRPDKTERIAVQPHIDYLPCKYGQLLAQFAVNIYMQVPQNGGELELWDIPALNETQVANLKNIKDWRKILPTSTLIKPTVGELIIFNSRRPHAVHQFTKGARISLQSFIGLTQSKQLLLWS